MKKDSKRNDEVERFVREVVDNKNLKANETLENILKKKVAERVKETLS